MFKGIKVKLLKRGTIQKVRLLSLLQDFEDRLEALENANGSGEGSNDSSSDSSESGSSEPTTDPVEPTEPTTEPTTGSIDVSFTVTYQGNPANGANVFISTTETPSAETIVGEGTTGSAGGCTIKDVSAGDYYIGGMLNSDGINAQKTPQQVTISKTNNHFDIVLV